MRLKSTSSYLDPARLADILALIQVLALDAHAHRSDTGLADELQGKPKSADSWRALAIAHPEFFRVADGSDHGVSLVARHVLPREGGQRKPLSPEYTSELLRLAVELHDREVRRSQAWHAWLPLLGVVLGALLTLFGIWLKAVLDPSIPPQPSAATGAAQLTPAIVLPTSPLLASQPAAARSSSAGALGGSQASTPSRQTPPK